MDAPFLDLAYYLGAERITDVRANVASRKKEGEGAIIGLPDRAEKVLVMDNSLIVRTEGEDFCGSMRADISRLQALGRTVYTSFLETAESLDCLYGAILLEYALETPEELRSDPRSLAFQDFYLSSRWLPQSLIEHALSVVPSDAFVRKLERGVYVSMTTECNPSGRGVERDIAQDASVRIGSLIGETVIGD